MAIERSALRTFSADLARYAAGGGFPSAARAVALWSKRRHGGNTGEPSLSVDQQTALRTGGALVFGAGLVVLAVLYFATNITRVALFWAAFIVTRPLGATVGDFLDKPVAKGGLEMSRPIASAVLAIVILLLILILPQRPGHHPGQAEANA